jgi:hypothetical protein
LSRKNGWKLWWVCWKLWKLISSFNHIQNANGAYDLKHFHIHKFWTFHYLWNINIHNSWCKITIFIKLCDVISLKTFMFNLVCCFMFNLSFTWFYILNLSPTP